MVCATVEKSWDFSAVVRGADKSDLEGWERASEGVFDTWDGLPWLSSSPKMPSRLLSRSHRVPVVPWALISTSLPSLGAKDWFLLFTKSFWSHSFSKERWTQVLLSCNCAFNTIFLHRPCTFPSCNTAHACSASGVAECLPVSTTLLSHALVLIWTMQTSCPA